MALVDVEFLRGQFAATVGLMVRARSAVPIPTLPPLGDDRLIREMAWKQDPVIETSLAGFSQPPGTVLLRFGVRIGHVSLAELRADVAAVGASVDADVWLLVNATPQASAISLVAVALAGQAPAVLQARPVLGSLPLPSFIGIVPVQAALVVNERIVVLRLATALSDDVLSPPANRLTAAIDTGVNANWLIYAPPPVFLELIRSRLGSNTGELPDGARIESGPHVSWTKVGGNQWGVHATLGIEVEDACPGLFGDVDISADITATAAIVPSPANDALVITLTVTVDASDWDSFRCWLGTGGVGSLPLVFISPLLQMPAALASLIIVSEIVRTTVGDQLAAKQIPEFTQVSADGDHATYTMSIPISPLPGSFAVAIDIGAQGIEMTGFMPTGSVTHEALFRPDHGPLGGTWHWKVNCSNRTLDQNFTFKSPIVSDGLHIGGKLANWLPVILYPDSTAEPSDKCWLSAPNAAEDLIVAINGPGMTVGQKGLAVLHTSAGLRAYELGPVPRARALPPEIREYIDKYCDTFRELRAVVEVQELKWLEPPPDYNYGIEAMRQWQIVLQDFGASAEVEILAHGPEAGVLARRPDFAHDARRAAISIVTDARTDIVMRAPRPAAEARFAVATRWLLPLQSARLPGEGAVLAKSGTALMVGVRDRWFAFDRLTGTVSETPMEMHVDDRHVRRPGSSVSLAGGRVAVVHGEALIIALPVQTIERE